MEVKCFLPQNLLSALLTHNWTGAVVMISYWSPKSLISHVRMSANEKTFLPEVKWSRARSLASQINCGFVHTHFDADSFFRFALLPLLQNWILCRKQFTYMTRARNWQNIKWAHVAYDARHKIHNMRHTCSIRFLWKNVWVIWICTICVAPHNASFSYVFLS